MRILVFAGLFCRQEEVARFAVVPHTALRFPLGLPQWNQQLTATSSNLRKKALLPACPEGSNDLMACERELIAMTRYSGRVAASIGTSPKESGTTRCAGCSWLVVIPPGQARRKSGC